MNLTWNTEKRRFEAKFTDFQTDLALVKEAGFKTDGPPQWVWYTPKAMVVATLRGKPGMTITPEARAQFNLLHPVEEQNAKTKAAMAEHQKALRKTLKKQKLDKERYDAGAAF